MLSNISIQNIAPEKVYTFPEKLTKDEIAEKVAQLHTIANEQADRNIYCLFEEEVMDKSLKFEVCFPVTHLDLKKYKVEDFKVLLREKVVYCDFSGDFSNLTSIIAQMKEYATSHGYQIKPPYRFLFTLHKKPLFSKEAAKFTMAIHIPVEETQSDNTPS